MREKEGNGKIVPEIDRSFENTMGNLLRAGVSAAAVLVLIGAAMYLVGQGSHVPDYSVFKGEPGELSTIGGIVRGALRLHSRSLIMFGLVVLILTPIARVILSLIAFAIRKDRIYTAVSAIVLAILLLSFFNLI